MKKISLLIIFVLVVQFVFLPAVYADDKIESVVSEGDEIVIHGMLDNGAGKAFILSVMSPDYDEEAGVTADNLPSMLINITESSADEYGAFSVRMKFDRDTPTGVYKIRLSAVGRDKNIYYDYSHLSSEDVDSLIGKINMSAGSSELKNYIEQYFSTIGIDFSGIYTEVSDAGALYDRLYSMLPIKTSAELCNGFNEACALETVYEAGTDAQKVQALIDTYPDIYKLSTDVFDLLENKDEIITAVFKKKYTDMESLKSTYDEAVALTAFSSLTRGEMEMLIEAYGSYLNLPSKYDSWKDAKKRDLYKELESKNKFDSFEEVSEAIKKFDDGYSTGGSGGSGGGGGSKSSSSSVHFVPAPSAVQSAASADVFDINTYFSDLSEAPWALEAIEYLYGKKVIDGKGNGKFEPNSITLREEAVKMLVNAFEIPMSDINPGFDDVSEEAWYYPFVSAASASGIVKGLSAEHFGTGSSLTRQDLAVIICRICGEKGIELTEKRPYVTFDDAGEIADYASEAVRTLYMSEIINGTEVLKFEPLSPVTRAMAAKMIYETIRIPGSEVAADE